MPRSASRGGAARPAEPKGRARRLKTLHLLYEPVRLRHPAPIRALVSRLKDRFPGLCAFRHSALTGDERELDTLVTFRVGEVEAWRRWIAANPGEPHRHAAYVPMRVRLGLSQRWPHGRGAFQVRRSLLLFAGSEARYDLEIPADAALTFQLGLVGDGRGAEPMMFTATFRASGTPGKAETLFEHHLGGLQAGRWLKFRVPLDRLSGQKGELLFGARRVRPGPRRAIGPVALAVPRMEYPEREHPPNVIVVVLDTVRPDALGFYGQRRAGTPNLDAVARRGAVFTNAFTNAPWTRPAMMAMFSARTPGVAGSSAGHFTASFRDARYLLEGGVSTVFEHLARRGYLNRVIANNVFMLPHEGVGHDHGISDFDHLQFGRGPRRKDNEAVSSAVERFCEENRNRRFFLHVLYESVHSPYRPPRYALDRLRKLLGFGPRRRLPFLDHYLAEVMVVDDHVNRIVRALDKNGLSSNTILVITSDHGETHADHHCFVLPRMGYNTCYKHSASLYDEVLRVPLILAGAGVPQGRKVSGTYRHIDLVPTLLDLMHLPPLPGARGRSVAGYLSGRTPADDRDVYAVGRGVSAVRRGGYKLIVREKRAQSIIKRGTLRTVVMELYDLGKDPTERRNLADRRPRLRKELYEAWKRHQLADRLPERFRRLKRKKKKKAADDRMPFRPGATP